MSRLKTSLFELRLTSGQMLRSGAPWRDLPERYGARNTCCSRFPRWRKVGA